MFLQPLGNYKLSMNKLKLQKRKDRKIALSINNLNIDPAFMLKVL